MADLIFPGEATDSEVGANWLPNNVDLAIWRGDKQDFVVAFTDANNNPIPLAGQTAQAQIKANFTASTSYNFTCTIQNTNQVRIYMSSAVSATIPAGSYVWDFQITDAVGDVRTYLAGDVTVYDQVTP